MRYHQFSLMSDIMESMALIILVLLGIYIAFRIYKQCFKGKKIIFGNNNALEILAERYAKGEISDEEYETKRNVLINKSKTNDKVISIEKNKINKNKVNQNNMVVTEVIQAEITPSLQQ